MIWNSQGVPLPCILMSNHLLMIEVMGKVHFYGGVRGQHGVLGEIQGE